uniref:Uncharacterized protein n=1 Tax=Lepeophtheirus salmonis TaxID=72036 RepID=A0A0K2TTA5_LEPSM
MLLGFTLVNPTARDPIYEGSAPKILTTMEHDLNGMEENTYPWANSSSCRHAVFRVGDKCTFLPVTL